MNFVLLSSASPKLDMFVEKLNKHIRPLMESLMARGETNYDLLSFLFKACTVVPGAKSRDHIKAKKSEHEEGCGTQDGQPFASDCLMLLRDNKCKSMTHDKTQITPSPEDEKFVTLQAEVTKLQHLIKSNPKKPPAIPKTPLKKGRAGKPACVTKEPTDNNPLVIKKNGKDCWWCPKHHSRGRHQPQDCEGKGVQRPFFKPEGDCESKLANAMPTLEENESNEES
jgi:hypothetical protein